MIERKFVSQRLREYQVQEYIGENLKRVGHSFTKTQRTPLGEKIVIHASRPGLVVGRKGQNIKKLTKTLKSKFGFENPQLEIEEVGNVLLDPQIMAERIANSLERYGIQRFKGIGHKVMTDVIGAGAMGVEIVISGKVPSSRAKTWRFYQGYLKKCGDIATSGVKKAYSRALLKTGIVGVQVRIMPPDVVLPDKIKLYTEPLQEVETLESESTEVIETKGQEIKGTKHAERKEGKRQSSDARKRVPREGKREGRKPSKE